MSDYSELVTRLRGVAGQTLLLSYPAQTTPDPLSNEAADVIELLQRELKCANDLWEQQKELALEYLADIKKANERIEKLERIAQKQADNLNVLRGSIANYQVGVHEARIAELEAALKPFADCKVMTLSDLRQARKVLGEKE